MLFVKLLTIVLSSALCVECYSYFRSSKTCGVLLKDEDSVKGRIFGVEDPLEENDGLEDDTLVATSQVIGGETAKDMWPWMVSIKRSVHFCGGAVIDKRHVITAAHCFEGGKKTAEKKSMLNLKNMLTKILHLDSDEIEIFIGEKKLKRRGKPYLVKSIKVHDEYDGAPNWSNDIAIMTLEDELPEEVVPVCLPEKDSVKEGDSLTVIGFGATEEGGGFSKNLQVLYDLNVIGNDECSSAIESAHKGHKGVTDMQVCTAYEEEEKGSCQGDSGGPLMQKISGKWTLIGLVSFSVGCARPGIPTVYTRIAKYKDWIEENTS